MDSASSSQACYAYVITLKMWKWVFTYLIQYKHLHLYNVRHSKIPPHTVTIETKSLLRARLTLINDYLFTLFTVNVEGTSRISGGFRTASLNALHLRLPASSAAQDHLPLSGDFASETPSTDIRLPRASSDTIRVQMSLEKEIHDELATCHVWNANYL